MKGEGVTGMLVVAILATMVVFVVADLAGGIGGFPNERWMAAIAMVCLAVWIGPGALNRYQRNGAGALKAVALWLVVASVVAFAFVYGHDTLASMGFNV